MPSGCLHENEVQALLEGALATARVDGVESHLDGCLKCQLLVSAAVRTASLRTHGLEGEASGLLHFEVGDVISNRYEITRFIARGGMGEVYAAHDRMLGDEIALKVLRRPTTAGAAALDRLRAEVQLARRVADPHVLRVFDLGSYPAPDGAEILFLTMQLLHGETLRARIRRAGPLPPDETWRLAGDMFAALGAAHQIGIVHRDFKSDNVMLVPTPDGAPRAIVMDFGLAQAVASDGPLKHDGTPLVAGTLGYMAPEQLAGGAITAAVDVYAFGVVLHEMLTGVLPPFRPVVGRRSQTAELPPPPSLLDKLDIPSRWSALIHRCLEREAGARFRNIIEARDALARAGGRKLGRRVAFAVAGGAVALAAAGGVLAWKRTSAVPVTPPVVTASPQAVPVTSPVVTAASSPAVSPPVARGAGEPAPPIHAAELPTAPAETEPAAPATATNAPRSRRPPPSARIKAKLEAAPAATKETRAPEAHGPAPSIADTDNALDPFR
jgi:hypothetical protein